jgi:uncharacterized membrane protein
MLGLLSRLNRFLLNQSVYPVTLSSMLALSIFIVRAFTSETWVIYANLVWNLFLAWIPYGFSLFAAILDQLFPRSWWLLVLPFLIWLVFFPNAPYIVTDFLHLAPRPDIPLWYDILLLAAFSWTGFFLAIASLRTMQFLVKKYAGGLISWGFVFIAIGLSGLGIYLGRFERWNSWDVLAHPTKIIKDVMIRVVDPFSNLGFFGFTILITALLLVSYLMFITWRPLEEAEGKPISRSALPR